MGGFSAGYANHSHPGHNEGVEATRRDRKFQGRETHDRAINYGQVGGLRADEKSILSLFLKCVCLRTIIGRKSFSPIIIFFIFMAFIRFLVYYDLR